VDVCSKAVSLRVCDNITVNWRQKLSARYRNYVIFRQNHDFAYFHPKVKICVIIMQRYFINCHWVVKQISWARERDGMKRLPTSLVLNCTASTWGTYAYVHLWCLRYFILLHKDDVLEMSHVECYSFCESRHNLAVFSLNSRLNRRLSAVWRRRPVIDTDA